jgi:DNA-binding transcriptional MerR regulator
MMPLVVGDLASTLWTTSEAAQAAFVKPRTVRNWALRGHLAPAGLDESNRPLYRAIDVIQAERKTRERARRSFPIAA